MRSIKSYGIIVIVFAFLLSIFAPAAAIASEGLPPVIPPPPVTPPGDTGG